MSGLAHRELNEQHDRSTNTTRFSTRDSPWFERLDTEVSATLHIFLESQDMSVWSIQVIGPHPSGIHETFRFRWYADLLLKIHEKQQTQQVRHRVLIFTPFRVLGPNSGYQLF